MDFEALRPEDQNLLHDYYHDLYKDMFLYATHMLGSPYQGEEAVQDTFVVAMEKIRAFKASPSPIGWLTKTLKNKIKHKQREKAKLLRFFASYDETPSLVNDLTVSGADAGLLIMDLDKVPELRLLYQYYILGESYHKLAKAYGTTVANMKMRVHRAKKRDRKSVV